MRRRRLRFFLSRSRSEFAFAPRNPCDKKPCMASLRLRPQNPSLEFTQNLLLEIQPFLLKGNYKSGLAVARRALKLYPNSFVCLYQYAKLLGDWADELPEAERKKRKREAAGILKKLTGRMAGQDTVMRFGACLNYYYQSYAFREMYAFGARFRRHDRRKGFYAQALGSGLLAESFYQKSKPAQARSWAKKSVAAWETYGLKGEKYYFAHYSYAKALAIAGDKKGAMKSLKIAARTSQRPITDWEFKDALQMIEA